MKVHTFVFVLHLQKLMIFFNKHLEFFALNIERFLVKWPFKWPVTFTKTFMKGEIYTYFKSQKYALEKFYYFLDMISTAI